LTESSCVALYLSIEPDPVLVLLDQPREGGRRPTAVLMVPPFGWDEASSYRGRRAWARALAHAGYPTTRLDLPATGDSAGSPRDPGRVEAWCGAVGGAAAWLRERVGAERVVAVGIGLGGALTVRAVADGAPIDDLVLWSVPARGRALLREMRAYSAMIASKYPEDEQNGPSPDDDATMLVGYLLSAETASEVSKLDLAALPLPNAAERRVLLLGRNGAAPDSRLREHFESAGASVTVGEGSGYDALMSHPQESRPPLKVIETTLAWLGDGSAARGPSPIPVGSRPAERPDLALGGHGAELRETPLWFELGGRHMFGVLSEPAEGPVADVTVVLFNGGALRHTGPNRSSVETARRWAGRGVPCVRVDFPGIGDADGDDPELTENKCLYAPGRLQETLAVLDQLAERGLPDRFVLGGLCAAAYWGVHAALADPRVVGVLAINLWAFFWSPELVAERDRRATRDALRSGLIERVRSGRLNAQLVRRAVRSFRPSRSRRGLHRSIERTQRPEVDRVLDQLRDQGTKVLLLLGRGEPLYEQFEREKRIEQMDRWPNVTLEQIPSRDHTFRALWLQRHVADSLDGAIERMLCSTTAEARPASG
jgi:pimeloyl-ACP methyl ester carboxylesterase